MPTRRLAPLLLVLAALALAVPAAAPAQQAPSLGADTTPTASPVTTTSSNPADSGLATWQQLLIFGAGAVLLAGIAWAIVGDARRRAPVEDRRRSHQADLAVAGSRGHAHDRQRQKDRARAKARAARASRKRNKRGR